MQTRLADKLVSVFRPEALGRLARRRQGRERCDVRMTCSDEAWNMSFGFSTQSKSDVTIDTLPTAWIDAAPAYLPTRELLTIYPGFVSVYENHYLEFDETWRDTCLLLGAPLKRGLKEKRVRELLEPLEEAMGGAIELDRNGRFYFRGGSGRMEMPLVAEGLRKLGMLARLIATLDGDVISRQRPGARPRYTAASGLVQRDEPARKTEAKRPAGVTMT
ncbi:hypothetical protein WME91_08515 [Sorangium sp. So ce269]